MSGVSEVAGAQPRAADASGPTSPELVPPGAPSPLTTDDHVYIERWADSLDGAGDDPRYTFGSSMVSEDWKRRARLLRTLLAIARTHTGATE